MKIRRKLSGIYRVLIIVLMIYVASASIMAVYYWWKDAKNHGSFLRTIAVSPFVGLFKSTHWPYYLFFKKDAQEGSTSEQTRLQLKKASSSYKIDENIQASIEGFFTGYEYLTGANKLARSLLNSQDVSDDLEKVKTLMVESKERFSQCDIRIMNSIYDGWGDIISSKAIPAIDLQLAGILPKADRNDLIRADALLAEFDNWMQGNWSKLLLRLNENYGYEVK